MFKSEVLNVKEVAEILGCSYRTILNYIRDDRLKAFKVKGFRRGDTSPWRIKQVDLDAFMNGEGQTNG